MALPAFEPGVVLWYNCGRHHLRLPPAFDAKEKAK